MMGNLRIESLAAQVDVLEPVVEAALAYTAENAGTLQLGRDPKGIALLKAVREYEAALKEEDDDG